MAAEWWLHQQTHANRARRRVLWYPFSLSAAFGLRLEPAQPFFCVRAVPQRPYITQGSLRTQVLFPSSPADAERNSAQIDAEIVPILKAVGLSYLLAQWGLDSEQNWSDILSLGEQQRLGFARLLYHAPAFAIMDEVRSVME